MNRLATCIALAASGLILCKAGAAGHTDPKTFPLHLERGARIAIAAKINGHPVTALLDSAAEATIIDKAWARELKLGQGEMVSGQGSGSSSFEAQLVKGVSLEAIGLRLADQTVAVADLSDVGQRLLHRRLYAILGRELFDAARLSIDIEGGRISVADRTREPPGIRVPLVTEHEVETIPVRIESGDPVHATFDLGNGSHILISSSYAERMHFLTDGRKITEERGGGLGGEALRQIFRVHVIEIAGVQFADVVATVDPNPSASDVNIGVSILRHFRITTDFSDRAVWLEPKAMRVESDDQTVGMPARRN